MDRIINVLDEKTIDKIAAGEVVERPASVVKELVENAIDADSSAITVEIKEGGISYIRVTDNGCGIEKNQVRTAFLRHATSKIKSIEDLINVNSLGFRGEALSSISSIAKVELLTKTSKDISGIRYVIEGSKELVFEDAGVPDGTTFIVRHLFYNTPARRKFLKSAQTEGGYIADYIEKVCLSHPNIAFKLIVNGNVKLQSSGNGSVKDLVYSLYGRDISEALLPIAYDDGDVKVSGFIGKPEIARGNRSFEIYFVNSRYIQSDVIKRALDEGYKKYLMLHKYPVVFLYFEISPELIDVNVHPTKKEIRFLESSHLYNIIVETILDAISGKELIVEIKQENKPVSDIRIMGEKVRPEPFENVHIRKFEAVEEPALTKEIKEAVEVKIVEPEYDELVKDIKPEQITLFEDGFLSKENVIKHRIIGQVFNTYWLIEMDNKLYIIDQHAAHEKVKYERIVNQLQSGFVASQMLNPPIIVTLSKSEEATLKRYYENFARIGFEIEHFGGNEYSIRQIPNELFLLTPIEYFHDLLDELMNGREADRIASIDHRIATMACKSAVKGNNRLSYEEATELINELLTLDNPYNCPHGRPTIISFTQSEIERMFKRIVN